MQLTPNPLRAGDRFLPLACLSLIASALFVPPPSNLHADGCFVFRWRNKDVDIHEPSQKAAIYWSKGQEVLVLQVKYEGAAEDFGWIVPLPSKPKVTAIPEKESPFEELSKNTQWRDEIREIHALKSGAPSQKEVKVLERKTVGVYDVAVLKARDASALARWLKRHHFSFPAGQEAVLQHYVARDWVYVAMRIDRAALNTGLTNKLRSGELQPIRFDFASGEMVYPLRISSANAGEAEVLLYIMSELPLVLKEQEWLSKVEVRTSLYPRLRKNSYNYYFDNYSVYFIDHQYGTYSCIQRDQFRTTWKALALPKTSSLYLFKYRLFGKAETFADDLSFEPFDPVLFWRNVLKDPNTEPIHKVRALFLLRGHGMDEDEYVRAISEILPEAVEGIDWYTVQQMLSYAAPPGRLRYGSMHSMARRICERSSISCPDCPTIYGINCFVTRVRLSVRLP